MISFNVCVCEIEAAEAISRNMKWFVNDKKWQYLLFWRDCWWKHLKKNFVLSEFLYLAFPIGILDQIRHFLNLIARKKRNLFSHTPH